MMAKRALRSLLGFAAARPGAIQMGDLERTNPVSRLFGFDRGTPIDRHYIEQFLAANAVDIRGRVLEVGEDLYSKRFGSGVTKQDILHVRDHPEATIVGDLTDPAVLPPEAFDCVILTQTLHLIYDMPAALHALRASLRPGGILLVTVPGVSSVDRGEWGASWCWSLTGHSARRLFGDVFGPDNVAAAAHGNVYAATCFLHGLAVEEVERDWLDRRDDSYPVIVTVRARR